VRIRNFLHKEIRKFYLEGTGKGLPAEVLHKLCAMLTVLENATDLTDLQRFPLWKAHQLTGDRKGTWSLNVTRNWRLTFKIEDSEITDVDYEDYH
jgi:toxin HigB-1